MGAKYRDKALSFNRSIPDVLCSIINRCLNPDPILRPKIVQIIEILESFNLRPSEQLKNNKMALTSGSGDLRKINLQQLHHNQSKLLNTNTVPATSPSHPLMFVHTNDIERLAAQRDSPIVSTIRPLNPSLSEQFKSLRVKVFDDHVPTERSEEFYSISFEFFMRIEDFKGAALTSKVDVYLTKTLSDCADHAVEVLESLDSIVHVRVTVSCAIGLELLQELIVNGAEATINTKSRTITTFKGCYRATVMFVPSNIVDRVSRDIRNNIDKETINVDIVKHHVNNRFYNLELLFLSSTVFSPESIFKGRSTADCLYAGKIDKFHFTVLPFQHYAHHSSCLEVVYYPFEEPTDDYLAALSAANPCVRKNSYLTTDPTKRHVLLWTSTTPTWPNEIVIKGHPLTKVVVQMFSPNSPFPKVFASEMRSRTGGYEQIAISNYRSWIQLNDHSFAPYLSALKECNRDLRNNHPYRFLLVIAQLNTLYCCSRGQYSYVREGENSSQTIALRTNQITNHVYSNSSIRRAFKRPPAPDPGPGPFDFLNKDCFEVAIDFINEYGTDPGVKIACLNMATEVSPGGGYRTGASAQEESLFSRSTLAYALDSSNVEGSRIPPVKYPWSSSDIDVIVSENIQIFKSSESHGLVTLSRPYTIDVVSSAAIERPDIKPMSEIRFDDFLNKEQFEFTFNRWVSIFLAAIRHNVTHLIISPLGCGAFRNPIESVMAILGFMEQIYGRFFQRVIFSVVGDVESFTRFRRGMDRSCSPLMTPTSFIPCPDLFGRCTQLNDEEHKQIYFHLDRCELSDKCKRKQINTHSWLCRHPSVCRQFSTCRLHQRDSSHDLSFTHALACHHGSLCKDQTPDHRESFWHRPICEKGHNCRDADCLKFKHHDHLTCPNPNCVDLTVLHQADVTHPIHLADDPFSSSASEKIVCPRGFQCTEMTTKSHMEKFAHLERKPCPDGTSCKSVDEIHLNTFSHPGVLEFRPPCSHGASCRNRGDLDHVRRYSHRNIRLFEILGNLMPDIGTFSGESKLDYVSNQRRLQSLLPKSPTPRNIKALGELLMRLRPVHRIKPETFESCLTHGAFYSLNMMKTKLADPAKVRQIVAASHYQLVNYSNQEQAADFLAVSTEIEMNGLLNKTMTCPDGMRVLMECTDVSKEERSELGRLAKNIAQAALDLNHLVGAPDESGAKVGIGFHVDKDLRTDRTVFSILGPNTNVHYGPIAVIFKSSVTKHPSTYLHVTAATKYYTHDGAVPFRPYIRIPTDETEKKNNYYKLVQNFGVNGAAETVALDMCHSLKNMKEHSKVDLSAFNISSVTKEIFVQSILKPDNHFTIECHLPSKISFSDVEHVVIPRNVYATLSLRAKHDLELLSGGKANFLILTDSFDSPDYLNKMIEASYNNEEELEYGFNILLTPQSHHRWAYLMASCSFERELCIRFDVNATGSFILSLVNGECPITFSFNNGYVSVYESANPNPDTPTLATLRMYFVKRMADKYIRFGIKINKVTGDICIERIDDGLEFKFDKIFIISKNLRNSSNITSQIKVQLESGSSYSYASFTHIELNTSKERITPRKVWAGPVDKKSTDVIHPKGKKVSIDKPPSNPTSSTSK
ncbi:hypothetical protein GEMRC1_012540 [Eukaryota sp. GEM-RC1]